MQPHNTPKLCECGCGQPVRLKVHRFVNGHQYKRYETTLEQKFWKYVTPAGSNDCWLWQGTTIRSGYGHIRHRDRDYAAHRIAYELAHGPIPDGLVVMHSCDNPGCVNVAHLSLGTHAENAQDKVRKGRAPRNTAHVNTKITDAQVAEARRRYFQENTPIKVLAKEYGIRWTTMNTIVFRQARKDVP